MGYTHYWSYKNPVFDLANNTNKKEDIRRTYRGDFERVKSEIANLPSHADLVKRIKKHTEAFKKIAAELNGVLPKIQQEQGFVLKGGMGEGEPRISENEVWFNGDGTNDQNLDHETFAIDLFETGNYRKIDEFDKEGIFGFCKTAYKPYDFAVMISLMVIKHHLGADFSISSDGGIEEWKDAIEYYEKYFNRSAPKQLKNYFKKEVV